MLPKNSLVLSFIIVVLLGFLISCSWRSSTSMEFDPSERLYHTKYSTFSDTRPYVFYNYVEDELVNDRMGKAIIRFDYHKDGNLDKIAFLDKDSLYCELAIKQYVYNKNRQIIRIVSKNEQGQILEEETLVYSYDDQGHLSKIMSLKPELDGKKSTRRSFWAESPVSKFTCDEQNRIIKEEFFNSNNETAILGDQGIKFITYEYNKNNQLTREIYHYTWVLKPDTPAKTKWINEYYYDEHGILTSSRYKFNSKSKEYDGESKFEYLKEERRYCTEDHPDIKKNYFDIQKVCFQEVYSNKFPSKHRYPRFRN